MDLVGRQRAGDQVGATDSFSDSIEARGGPGRVEALHLVAVSEKVVAKDRAQ